LAVDFSEAKVGEPFYVALAAGDVLPLHGFVNGSRQIPFFLWLQPYCRLLTLAMTASECLKFLYKHNTNFVAPP